MKAAARAALAAGLLLAALGTPWAGNTKLPPNRAYCEDLTLSVPLPKGWNESPHELGYMNDHPKDIWISNERTGQELRFTNTDQTWDRLRSVYGRPGFESYKTETGISAILRFKDPDVAGAFECYGARWELKGHGVTYPELRYLFDNMACRTTKEPKKKSKAKPRRSAEPEL